MMAHQRYSLRFLFAVMTATCVAAWVLTSPAIGWIVAIVVAACAVSAEWGRRRDDHPVGYGALGGVAAVAGLILVFGGMAAIAAGVWVGWILLVIYFVMLAPVAAGVGALVGLIDWAIADRVARPMRAERGIRRADQRGSHELLP
jgi:hypothetical protein